MLTFHWSELLVIVLGGLVLLLGLAFLMLRRRNEMLQEFLTPEEPHLEEEFFRVREIPPKEEPEETEETEETEPEEQSAETAQWGNVPKDVVPKDVAPGDATSNDTTPQDGTTP